MSAPLGVEGPGAPPRSSGELVFGEPWESRAFGMAVSLYEAGAFTWPRFRAALIARIAAWEDASTGEERYDYHLLWLEALEDVLVDLRAVSADEVTVRVAALARRPEGHDHRRDQDRPATSWETEGEPGAGAGPDRNGDRFAGRAGHHLPVDEAKDRA
ncbi:nitrile hydratase accessory protein [Streptomyces fagopyri]|uniref:Nitrile hydratase accessory protein n=1 Tax=Streptomyces fagopyri TaxID=2662397 RepID=A0A5Q0L7P6_9ACTN|nr:nitrile hydratase accessory protein [Streptomyces fagopyri]QFZ73070.1 nitrile hydratase accessory protein [Streptomyces fagopyri]